MPKVACTLSFPSEFNVALTDAARRNGTTRSALIVEAVEALLNKATPAAGRRPALVLSAQERVVVLALERAAGLDDPQAVTTPVVARLAGLTPLNCNRLLRRMLLRGAVEQSGDGWEGERQWPAWKPVPRVMVWLDMRTGHRTRLVDPYLFNSDGTPARFSAVMDQLHKHHRDEAQHVRVADTEF